MASVFVIIQFLYSNSNLKVAKQSVDEIVKSNIDFEDSDAKICTAGAMFSTQYPTLVMPEIFRLSITFKFLLMTRNIYTRNVTNFMICFFIGRPFSL